MSLAERLKEARRVQKGFDLWVSELPEDDRKALLAAAADPAIQHRVLFEIVKTEGACIGRERFTDWRKANGFPR